MKTIILFAEKDLNEETNAKLNIAVMSSRRNVYEKKQMKSFLLFYNKAQLTTSVCTASASKTFLELKKTKNF